MFEQHKVLNARELQARCEINYEAYNKTINIEAQLMVLIANRYILPAAIDYQGAGGAVGGGGEGGRQRRQQPQKLLDRLGELDRRAEAQVRHARARSRARRRRAPRSTPSTCATASSPRWSACARPATRSRSIVPHGEWPLPTYREMLFIK